VTKPRESRARRALAAKVAELGSVAAVAVALRRMTGLTVSVQTVRKWHRGVCVPSGKILSDKSRRLRPTPRSKVSTFLGIEEPDWWIYEDVVGARKGRLLPKPPVAEPEHTDPWDSSWLRTPGEEQTDE